MFELVICIAVLVLGFTTITFLAKLTAKWHNNRLTDGERVLGKADVNTVLKLVMFGWIYYFFGLKDAVYRKEIKWYNASPFACLCGYTFLSNIISKIISSIILLVIPIPYVTVILAIVADLILNYLFYSIWCNKHLNFTNETIVRLNKQNIWKFLTYVFILLMFAAPFFSASINDTEINVNNEQKFYVENSIVCDKFFNVSSGMKIETDEEIANVVKRIHEYCPGEPMFISGFYTENEIKATYKQLETWSFADSSFIHSYNYNDTITAYLYVSNLKE